jgi:hypothetical protein
MTVVAVASIVLGVALTVGAFVWYGSWSFPAILAGIFLACAGGLWLCAVAVSKGFEEH